MEVFEIDVGTCLKLGNICKEKSTGNIGYYIRNTFKACGHGFKTGSMFFSSNPKSVTGEWSVYVSAHVELIGEA